MEQLDTLAKVRAAPVITGIFSEIQKFLDIEMPGFEIGAHRAFTLAALVYGHGRVVGNLEKGHDTL
ncbi:hypothetical protein D3C83_303590 [compost metagenome]